MASPPHIRCPTCGSMAKEPSLRQAGSHQITIRRVLRGLGRGKGFEWSTESVAAPALRFLLEVLERATAQVQAMAASTPEALPLCSRCQIGLAWEPRTWVWHCTSCGLVVPAE